MQIEPSRSINQKIPLWLCLAFAINLLAGCATMEGIWSKAQRTDSTRGYELFIESYPDSPHVPEARSRIENLTYERAANRDQISDYEKFIEKYPTGILNEQARNRIAVLQKEKEDLFSQLQRVSADYANYQKRVPKQIGDTISYEKERIIKSLLPALDNFEHTLQNAHSAEDVDVLVKGIQIIYDQLIEILKSNTVEQIKALGETFDPCVHEAMTQQTDTEKDQNVVLEEFQKGYRLNGRIIRPSRVIVNKLPEEKPGDGQEGQPPEQPEDENDAAGECESTDSE